jgi:transcriptional regulator GlxA family with amidase domain
LLRLLILAFISIVGVVSASAQAARQEQVATASNPTSAPTGVLHAAFVCTPGVYNSELMAPFDVLHHSVFRDSVNHIQPFIVTHDGGPITTFEGIRVQAHHSFESVPRIDILVIPSTENSMGSDLEDARLMDFLRDKIAEASWVMTLCDGAFPLAATGALDGRVATTFPGDRDAFAARFAAVDVRYDANFVVDGKFITSVGGALSYEPALYLVQTLYSREHAERSAQGLVLEWQLDSVPHVVIGQQQQEGSLHSFQWLLGEWVRRTAKGEAVETWKRVSPHTFEGTATHTTQGETMMTETLRLEQLGDDVFYTARPRQNLFPTAFRLIENDARRFVFENPEHDFPQRIVYERMGAAKLHVRIEGDDSGGSHGVDFHFVRR